MRNAKTTSGMNTPLNRFLNMPDCPPITLSSPMVCTMSENENPTNAIVTLTISFVMLNSPLATLFRAVARIGADGLAWNCWVRTSLEFPMSSQPLRGSRRLS